MDAPSVLCRSRADGASMLRIAEVPQSLLG